VANADSRVRLLDGGSWDRSADDVPVDDLGPLQQLQPVDGGIAVIGARGARLLSWPGAEVGEAVRPADAGPEDLATVAVAPDGRRAAVTTFHGTEVEVRDLSTSESTGRVTVPCRTGVTALAWSPQGDVLAATCADLGLALLDPAPGAVLGTTGTAGGSALAFSPDGDRVAVVGTEAVTVLDRSTLAPVTGPITVARPRTARFSADGGQVAVGGEGRVLVWDLEEDRRVDELVGMEEAVVGLVSIPEGRFLVATASTVSEWQLDRVPPLAAAVGDGTDVLAVDDGGTRYGPLPDGPGLRVTTADEETTAVALANPPCAVDPAPGGGAVVVSTGAATELRRLPGGRVLASLSDELALRACTAGATAFSPDGDRLAAVGSDGGTAVWDVRSGEVVADGRTEAGATSVGWSGDGRSLVTGGATGTLRAWDGASLEEATTVPLAAGSPISGVESVAGGDRVVATVASGEIVVVDLGDGDTVGKPFKWGGTDLRGGLVSPDGRLLAAMGTNGNLRLWDVPTHTVLGPGLRAFAPGATSGLVFTGDDELATWDGEGAALRWRVDVDAWAETACGLAGRPVTEDEWEQYLPGERYDPACDGTSA
jgi:WD40 repeat protein